MQRRFEIDQTVALVAITAYFALVLTWLPLALYPRMLIAGVVVYGGLVLVARMTRTWATAPMSILIVSFGAAALLLMPGFPAFGGESTPALWIGAIGTEAAVLLWIWLRWQPGLPIHRRKKLREVLLGGVMMATILSAVAAIPIVIGLLADREKAMPMLLVFPGYFAGISLAALTYWALQGISHYPSGKYLIGVLGGAFAYLAIAPVVYLSEGKQTSVTEMLEIGLTCGFLVGPPLAFMFLTKPSEDRASERRGGVVESR